MYQQYKIPIYSLLTGIIITLITGFFPNVFIIGTQHWGYLLPWMSQIVYPGAPLEIMWINFIVDIVIWSVLMYLAFLSVEEEKEKPVEIKKPVKAKPKKKPVKKKTKRKR